MMEFEAKIKRLSNLKLSELVEEFRKTNSEGGRIVSIAMDLNVLDLRKDEVNSKVKQYELYGSEVAKEFIRRFM